MANARKPLTVESVLRTLARVEEMGKLGGYEDVAAALSPHVEGSRTSRQKLLMVQAIGLEPTGDDAC